MRLGYAKGKNIAQQIDNLEDFEVSEIFSDHNQKYEGIQDPESEFQRLLDYAEPGDCLVIDSLEVLSRDYGQLLDCINEVEHLDMDMIVLLSPDLTISEWRDILKWSRRNDRLIHPRLIKLNMKNSKNSQDDGYSIFSRDEEAKQLYRMILGQLLGKKKLKEIARKTNVPIETVYRIQQEFKRIKLAVILAICFFLAIGTIKIAEVFSDNIWIQIGICIVGTLTILYNTLTENDDF